MITVLSLSPAIDKIYYIDNFEAGKLYRMEQTIKSAGGKGSNVARVTSILGEKVAALGFKAGEAGNWLENQLKWIGISTEFIEVEGESRTNTNIIDREKGTETEVLEAGPFIALEDLDYFFDLFKKTLQHTTVLVCSGGLPRGVPVDFYRRLIEIAKPMGVKVILDTSNEILEEAIKAVPYLVKPNLRELSKYVNKELTDIAEILQVCRSIIATGVKYMVVSMGSEGALLVSEDAVLRAKAPEVRVKNTIGSGDSMVAGLAVGLEREYGLAEMFKLGMASAVANTQFDEAGFVSLELVVEYFKEIEVVNFGDGLNR